MQQRYHLFFLFRALIFLVKICHLLHHPQCNWKATSSDITLGNLSAFKQLPLVLQKDLYEALHSMH